MGYFTQQIYQQPQSMYVDPRLDILQQSAATIQGRHDKAVSEMSAYDIMAANLKVAEGDQAYKDQKIAELAAQSKAIADSGDYAMAQPRINQAAKGFLADQNLITMQENRAAIDAYQKHRQSLGANAIDFNPADGWATLGEDGKARRFVADVQAKEDWDGDAQRVSKLIADERPMALQGASIDGYLKHGSIGGINDTKVRNYLEKAIDRFDKTASGSQMRRVLMEKQGMSKDQADAEIARFVHNVADAQVHSRVNESYMFDQMAAEKRQNAHEIEIAQIRASGTKKGRTNEDGSEAAPNPFLQMVAPETTTITNDNLKNMLPEGQTLGTFRIPLEGQIVDYAKTPNALAPADAGFMDLYEKYRTALGDVDGSPTEMNKANQKLLKQEEAYRLSLESGRVVFWDSHKNKMQYGAKLSEDWTSGPSPSREEIQKKYDDIHNQVSTIKAIEAEATKHGVDLKDADRYKKLNQDPSGILGKVISLGGEADFRINQGTENKRNVGNNMYLEGKAILEEEELNRRMKSLGYGDERDYTGSPLTDEWQEVYLAESGGNGMISVDRVEMKDGKEVKYYSIPIKHKQPISHSVQNTYNKNALGDTGFNKHLNVHTRELSTANAVGPASNRISKIKDEALRTKVQEIAAQAYQDNDSGALEYIVNASDEQLRKELNQ